MRAHLHRIIDNQKLNLFHETGRKGHPYTLFCTKNRASFERKLEEYAKEIDKMFLLIEMTQMRKGTLKSTKDLLDCKIRLHTLND